MDQKEWDKWERLEQEAILKGDHELYTKAINMLGKPPEIHELYNEPITEITQVNSRPLVLEELAEVPYVWNITESAIGTLSNHAQANLYSGLQNLEIPIEMLDSMNPDEIIAKNIGAAIQKKRNLKIDERYVREYNFTELYRLLDGLAYPTMNGIKKRFESQYQSKPGDQRRRLSVLSDDVKIAFVESFKERYIPILSVDGFQEGAINDNLQFDEANQPLFAPAIYQLILNLWDKRIEYMTRPPS